MLQIIGWMGCLYLVIKGLEISFSSSSRDENGEPRRGTTAAFMLCWGGAIVFAIWLFIQGAPPKQVEPTRLTEQQIECINSAANEFEVMKCTAD